MSGPGIRDRDHGPNPRLTPYPAQRLPSVCLPCAAVVSAWRAPNAALLLALAALDM